MKSKSKFTVKIPSEIYKGEVLPEAKQAPAKKEEGGK
mgnify:CR=1 FL=1